MNDLKTEFVFQQLQDIAGDIDKAQKSAIQKYLHYKTGRLTHGRRFTVAKGNFLNGEMTLEHPIYERFLDIKKKLKASKSDGGHVRSKRRFRSYPIHNRIIMGHFNRLSYQLLYGFTDEVASQMKKNLDNQNI